MRPDLTYLDRIAAMDRRANAAHKGGDQSEDDEDEEEDEEKKRKAAAAKAKKEASEAKTLNVTFKNNEEKFGSLKGAATGRQDGSLFAPWRAEEAEPWVSLPHYAPNVSSITSKDSFGPLRAWRRHTNHFTCEICLSAATPICLSTCDQPITWARCSSRNACARRYLVRATRRNYAYYPRKKSQSVDAARNVSDQGFATAFI